MQDDDADTTVEAATAEATAAFAAALAEGDVGAAARAYTLDARLLAPSAEVFHGRGAIAAFWRAGLDSGVAAVDLEPLELEPHDGLAYETGRYTLRLNPDEGDAVVDRGTYLLVHERQPDGTWRRAAETFNPDATPARLGGRTKEET